MLLERFKEENITLEVTKVNDKCLILHNDSLFLGWLGVLLGYQKQLLYRRILRERVPWQGGDKPRPQIF